MRGSEHQPPWLWLDANYTGGNPGSQLDNCTGGSAHAWCIHTRWVLTAEVVVQLPGSVEAISCRHTIRALVAELIADSFTFNKSAGLTTGLAPFSACEVVIKYVRGHDTRCTLPAGCCAWWGLGRGDCRHGGGQEQSGETKAAIKGQDEAVMTEGRWPHSNWGQGAKHLCWNNSAAPAPAVV